MRRQTLALLPAILIATAISGILGWQMLRARLAARDPAPWHRIEVQGLSLEAPPGASAPVPRPGSPWMATEFQDAALGRFRIAREHPQGDLQGALRDWFQLPGPLDRPLGYRMRGQPALARPIQAFGPSGYFLQHQGRILIAVCVFDLGEYRYWLQTRVADGPWQPLAGFHRVLLSLRSPEGTGVDARLESDLRLAETERVRGRIRLDPAWFAGFPAGMMLLAAAIASMVRKRSGRPARIPGGTPAAFEASGVEVAIRTGLQRRYFDAALAVLDDRLVLYTFGTPLLNLPKDRIRGQISQGTAWFGPPFLEITLEGRLDYPKHRFRFGLWAGRTRVRILTEDVSRLRMALGA